MKVTSMRKKHQHPSKLQSSGRKDAQKNNAKSGKRAFKQDPSNQSKPARNRSNPSSHASKSEARHSAISIPRDAVVIWGRHAVGEALKNPQRKISKIYVTPDMTDWLAEYIDYHETREKLDIQRIDKSALSDGLRASISDEHIVHQGIVAMARPLNQPSLEDWLEDQSEDRSIVILLDQITDARNIGAIMRSARAFRATAIIATDRHCPEENGAMLRTASGAMDHLPLIRVVNLARAMEKMQDHGYMLAGMTARGQTPLPALAEHHKLGIILGAEGKGLRRLTEDHADILVRIPIDDQAESLNVSNAAAVALYAAQPQDD